MLRSLAQHRQARSIGLQKMSRLRIEQFLSSDFWKQSFHRSHNIFNKYSYNFSISFHTHCVPISVDLDTSFKAFEGLAFDAFGLTEDLARQAAATVLAMFTISTALAVPVVFFFLNDTSFWVGGCLEGFGLLLLLLLLLVRILGTSQTCFDRLKKNVFLQVRDTMMFRRFGSRFGTAGTVGGAGGRGAL